MVEFQEIKDEHYEGQDDGFVDEDSDAYSDVSSESDVEDDENAIHNETIFDRIAALKDIIPAQQRNAISRTLSKTFSYGSMATFIGGKAVYIIITSILMAGIPYALALEEERMVVEQEKQMQMQQGMSEVMLLFGHRYLTHRCLHRLPLEQSLEVNLRRNNLVKFIHPVGNFSLTMLFNIISGICRDKGKVKLYSVYVIEHADTTGVCIQNNVLVSYSKHHLFQDLCSNPGWHPAFTENCPFHTVPEVT